MVLYNITLVLLAEDIRVSDLRLLSPLFVDDAAFNGSARIIDQLSKLLMERELDQRYFPEPAKLLFIADTQGHEEAA